MATIPIFSPTLPFLGLIPGGLSPGRMLRIKGIINSHGERCQIHIQAGAAVNPRDDVPLHISIRPNEHAIVRNSIQNKVVGPEERYGGCPIRYGESFDLLILAESSLYKLAINGVHFCTFAHRLPVHNARYISISGGGVIYSIVSESDVPGSVPVHPYPQPPIVQHPTPYAPPIGFVPNAPPSSLPPPPPYTPLPTHPIGGGGGHYPGVGMYPPPPPPPQPGYPHHPPPGAHPPAVPFSLGFVTMPTPQPPMNPGYGAPGYPTAPPPSFNMAGGNSGGRHQPGGFKTPAGLAATTALAAGTTAAVASKVLPKGKTKKLLKYGAAAGAVGLGGYALSKAFHRKSSSSSSSSDSD
ncbi:galectin-9-like isoform X1 [Anopheles funestus]|uniref:galectin-9-like isoform X1 n=1 Tax=Anopheles funestus TaxID=62324 RepID=UPI0020C6FCD1|nr:galectin-9-like isoform X1 [Anopheles funestus]